MRIGKKIYYEIATGNPIVTVGELYEGAPVTTTEEDVAHYKVLSERNRNTFDVLELPAGAFSQDFAESIGYRVNLETKKLDFSYPDPNEPEAPQVFKPPLSEEVEKLKQEDLNNKEAIAELYMINMGGF